MSTLFFAIYSFSLFQVYNLGTGHGYSVMDMIQALSKASGKEVSLFYYICGAEIFDQGSPTN